MTTQNQSASPIIPAAAVLGVSLAIGLILMGYFISGAVMESHRGDRTVTVHGVSTREVEADAAVWSLRYRLVEDDPGQLAKSMSNANGRIVEFLKEKGLEPSEITIFDPVAEIFPSREEVGGPGGRFLATGVVVLDTKNIPAVLAAKREIATLRKDGIFPVDSRGRDAGPQFLFTGVEDVAPGMLKEAAENARHAAAQFGDAAGTAVGAVRRADIGSVQVLGEVPGNPPRKTLRVESKVEYFLK